MGEAFSLRASREDLNKLLSADFDAEGNYVDETQAGNEDEDEDLEFDNPFDEPDVDTGATRRPEAVEAETEEMVVDPERRGVRRVPEHQGLLRNARSFLPEALGHGRRDLL